MRYLLNSIQSKKFDILTFSFNCYAKGVFVFNFDFGFTNNNNLFALYKHEEESFFLGSCKFLPRFYALVRSTIFK